MGGWNLATGKTTGFIWNPSQIIFSLSQDRSFTETVNKDKTSVLQQSKREEVLEQGMYAYFCNQAYKSIPYPNRQPNFKVIEVFQVFLYQPNTLHIADFM